VNTRRLEVYPVGHDRSLHVIHFKSLTLGEYLFFRSISARKNSDCSCGNDRVRVKGAEKISVPHHGKKETFGTGPNTASPIDRDCAPLENVKVFSSNLVRLYRTNEAFAIVSL